MEIFQLTKQFPIEEKYSLIDQIRRSSRSICTSLAEGWRKRRYKAAFLHKISEAGQEAAETQTWLEFALACDYLHQAQYATFNEKYEHIFAMLIAIERKSDSFTQQLFRPSS